MTIGEKKEVIIDVGLVNLLFVMMRVRRGGGAVAFKRCSVRNK